MKHFYAGILFVLFIGTHGQVRFEPGKYLDNQQMEHRGLISNRGWIDNPVAVEFKASENDIAQTLTRNEVSYFEVGDNKFRRYNLKVDISPMLASGLSKKPQPEWQEETVMLRVLSSGRRSLYSYSDNGLIRYFYSEFPHQTVEQLVYKEFQGIGSSLLENNHFRQQLALLFKDADVPVGRLQKIRYSESDLTALFDDFGDPDANAEKAILAKKPGSGASFYLYVGAGAASGTIHFRNYFNSENFEFQGTAFVPMIEVEYVFGFNRNKWSAFLSPSSFTMEDKDGEATAKYTILALPAGVRYRMFVSDNLIMHLEAGVLLALASNSDIRIANRTYEIQDQMGLFAGTGISLNRFMVGLRYMPNRNLLSNLNQKAEFSSLELVGRFRIF